MRINCSTWRSIFGSLEVIKKQIVRRIRPRVEAGINTSTVTLRVVGGDEKGSLESETVNYGHESHGSRTSECLRWRGPGAIVNDISVLSSEREPHINKPATDTNKNQVVSPIPMIYSKRNWPNDGRKPNISLNSDSEELELASY
jgi:hypothetical protein